MGPKIYILRYGHRPQRDKRITSHVALVARSFGAHGFILADVKDDSIERTIKKVSSRWGGSIDFIQGVSSYSFVKEWKRRGGEIIHLTMYGLHIDYVIDLIRRSQKDKLVIVGAEKVPRFFYRIADFNVAVGHQPHSEVAALAVFLDKYFMGRELYLSPSNPTIRIAPSVKGKRVIIYGD